MSRRAQSQAVAEPASLNDTNDATPPARPDRRGRRPLTDDRRRRIADAAIQVLATEGARGLNHRAIDRFLGLPAGSTSYYFPKRTDLLAATAQRISDVNLAGAQWAYDQILEHPGEFDARRLAEQTAGGILRRLGAKERAHTIAYFEMTLDGTRVPAHRAVMRRELDMLWTMWRHIFQSLGARDPNRAAKSFMAFTLGHAFMFICRPDVRPRKADLVELVHGHILHLLR